MNEAHFVDTSALVKRYIDERGSTALHERTFGRTEVAVLVSSLTYAEMYATFSRLLRDGEVTVAEHRTVLERFERDWSSFVIVEFGPSVRNLVAELASAHALRGSDLAQLASAAHMRSRRAMDLFVVCDLRLANAATLINLSVFNPELEPGDRRT
ncbi:MAG: type II toxin-antitoxin system VapC family toxin [Bradymonadales bacterium]|nr:type II toxin-antitoxin system VapC family toxin [Bradymonadales bacterium]